MKIGFNHEKYLEEQSKYILERVNNHDKLYIEFGGKLLADLHAKRVLPVPALPVKATSFTLGSFNISKAKLCSALRGSIP